MITMEQAEQHLPVGTRVQHRSKGVAGSVAVCSEDIGGGKSGATLRRVAGLCHLANERSACYAINVEWDDGRTGWEAPWDLVKLPDGSPIDTIDALNAEMAKVGIAMPQEWRDEECAKAALWLAYRGNAERLDAVLATCSPEVIEGLAAAARLLTAASERSIANDGI
jgi:hypothetical protein